MLAFWLSMVTKRTRSPGSEDEKIISKKNPVSRGSSGISSHLGSLPCRMAIIPGSRSASELVAPLKRFHHTGEVNFHVADAKKTLEDVERQYAGQAKSISKIDGVSIDMGDYWFNLRPSNTEPVVRLNLESLVSREQMSEKQAAISAVIQGTA